MNKYKVAFIGLGVMGYPMAGHLSNNGYDVSIFNRTTSKAENWSKKYKGQLCLSPAEASSNADFIMTCVGRDEDLKEVLEGKNGVLTTVKKDAIIIDHTTASAEIAKYFYNKCKKMNLGFLDAPISGGQAGAENGKLSIMVGGDDFHYDKSLEILKSYGKTIKLIGTAGSGQLCKMVNQICITGLLQGLSEALSFGKKSNLNMKLVLEVISKGAAQSWQMDNRTHTMINDEFEFGFAVDWMCKDLNICFNHAKKVNANLPITEIVYKYYEQIKSNGGNRWDTSSLISLLK